MTYVSVRPERHSYNMIKETGEFVINVTTEALAYATDWCGVRSGSKYDKFKEMKLTKEECSSCKLSCHCPKAPMNIMCKVKEIVHLGSHDMFVAEVVGTLADEKYMDEKGKFIYSDTKPICYSHGEYYGLGKKLGKFGYSVEKKKTKAKRAKRKK